MQTRKKFTALMVSGALVAGAPAPTFASDLGKALVGIGVGAAIICATGHCKKKSTSSSSSSKSSSSKSSAKSSAQYTQNKSVQQALNAFGFNVGTADGSLGPKSRSGISSYQAYMGWPATGYLDDYQRNVLLESQSKMNAGAGAAYPQVVAQEGTKGLLKAFTDPNYPPRSTAVSLPTNPPQTTPQPPQVTPPQVTRADEPSTGVLPSLGGAAPTLPSLAPLPGLAEASTSMAERCELVGLITETNQGPMKPGSLTDADQALSEQFCDARSFAMTDGQSMADSLNLTADQVATACETVAAAMEPIVASFQSDDVAAVTAAAKTASGQIAPDAKSAVIYGKVCTATGYKSDDADIALGGTLMMVGAGHAPYGELIGHHLREGFGTGAKNPGAAVGWYMEALSALEQNQAPAFLPSRAAERAEVIREAINSGVLQASNGTLSPVLPSLVAQ